MMNARRAAVLISLPLLAALPFAAMAQVYTWKDADGKTHYGSRPPPGKQVESRKLAAPPPVDAEAARQSFNERQLAEREKQQKAQEEGKKAQEEQAQARQREENCRNARSNLAAIESGQIRYTIDAKGERAALDGALREAELARARKSVSDWCSPPPASK
jgi:hypothetical protein